MATGRGQSGQGGGCGGANVPEGRSFPKFNPVMGRPSSSAAAPDSAGGGANASGCCRPHSVLPKPTDGCGGGGGGGGEAESRQICCSAHPNVSSACCSARGPAMPRGPPRRPQTTGGRRPYRVPLPLGGNCGRPIPLASLKDIYKPVEDASIDYDDAWEGAEEADVEEGDVTATHSCPLSSASPEPRPCCCRRQPAPPQQLQVLLRAATVSGSPLGTDAELTPPPTPDNANHPRGGKLPPLPTPPQDKRQAAPKGREGRRAAAATAEAASKPRRSATQPPPPPQQQRRGSLQSLVQKRSQPAQSSQQQQQPQQQPQLTRPGARQQRPQSWRMPPPPPLQQRQQPPRASRVRSRSSPAPLYSPVVYNNSCRTSDSGDDDNCDRWLALTPPPLEQEQQQPQPQQYHHASNSLPQNRQWQQQWQQQQRQQQWQQQQQQQQRRRQQQQQPDPHMHIYRRPLCGLMRSRADAGGRSCSVTNF